MISKELLSELLKSRATTMEYYNNCINKELVAKILGFDDIAHIQREGKSSLFISRYNNPAKIINIYELSYLCKKWAYTQGYSYIGNNKLCNIHSKEGPIIAITNNDINKWYEINIDLIACKWIMENKCGS